MSTARFNTLQNASGSKSVPVDTVVDGSAKAWVNFNGQGTVAIRAAFNVSSITDNGVGDYTVNFSTALADANYAVCGSAQNTSTNTALSISSTASFSLASGSARLATRNGGNTLEDPPFAHVAFFR